MRNALLAKARGRELHAQGALESDIFLLFSEAYNSDSSPTNKSQHGMLMEDDLKQMIRKWQGGCKNIHKFLLNA